MSRSLGDTVWAKMLVALEERKSSPSVSGRHGKIADQNAAAMECISALKFVFLRRDGTTLPLLPMDAE